MNAVTQFPSAFMRFDGETFDHGRDSVRLTSQLERVFDFMSDGQWHVLDELVMACGGTEASASARLRDLRKPRFGGHTVERKYLHDGIWAYRLLRTERC
jgi:hypothetical protein